MSEANEAAGLLATTREHVAILADKTQHLQSECAQLISETQSRFEAVQHDFEQLQSHVQSEHQRADAAQQALVTALHDAQTWLAQAVDQTRQGVEGVDQELTTFTSAIAHDVETLTQESQSNGQAGEASVGKLKAHQEHASSEWGQPHQHAHETLSGRLTDATTHTEQSSRQSDTSVNNQVDNTLTQEESQFSSNLHKLAETGQNALSKRGDELHSNVARESDELKQEHDSQHQAIMSDLNTVEQGLSQLQSLLSDDGSNLAHTADQTIELMQSTNIAVEEIMKIINNVIDIFQEVIAEKP